MPRATIKTIAKEAGVSIATVSKAMNDMPDVSSAVKIRIRAIAQRQGYVVNAAAKQLASGRSHLVGVIMPDLIQHHFSIFYQTLSSRLYRAGYSCYMACSDGDLKAEASLAADMVAKGVDALVIASLTTDTRHCDEAVNQRVPIVYVGGAANQNAEHVIACDDFNGGMLAGRALHKGGCKITALFTWGAAAAVQHQRVRGFMAYMQENAVPVTVHQVLGGLHEDGGGQLMRQLLLQNNVDGIFCTDDILALGALAVLRRKNIQVPQEIQLVGYGDSPCAALSLAQLTSIARPFKEIGICASDLVLSLFRDAADVVKKMTLEPQLVQRETTVAAG